MLNNVINHKLTVIYGNGSTIRDYICVKDVAELVYRALISTRCGIYNAGSGQGFSINQIIETIEEVTGQTVQKQYSEARDFDVSKIVLDNTLAEEHFGWKASKSLTPGLKQQFEWLQTQYNCTTVDNRFTN